MPNEPHDSWACVYDKVYEESFGQFYSMLTNLTLGFIKRKIKNPSKILDIGAGTGRLSIPLSELGFSVTAVEASSEMLKLLSEKDSHNNISKIHTKIQNLDLDLNFDLILCVFSVFCYLTKEEDLRTAIEKLSKHLSQNGQLLIDVPTYNAFQGIHYRSDTIERNVQVNEVDADLHLFQYNEKIAVGSNEDQKIFEDQFLIRYWDSDFILSEFKKCGIILKEDLSQVFAGSGARYFLLEGA